MTEELNKKLKEIMEKRSRNEQLTYEEEELAKATVDKLLGNKRSVNKVVEIKTGDEIRKQNSPTLAKPKSTKPSFEDGNPKSRGFEGGYDSKANVDERVGVSPDPGGYTGKPPVDDPKYFSEEGKEMPKEDTSGAVKAVYTDEEYADVDNKEYKNEYYEENRVGNYIEGKAPHKDSIKIKDIVTKQITKNNKLVGFILKIYAPFSGQRAVLVKWSNGTYSHENTRHLTLLKATGTKSDKPAKEEDEKVSPPVRKADRVARIKEHVREGAKELGQSVREGAKVLPKRGVGAALGAFLREDVSHLPQSASRVKRIITGKSIQTEDVKKQTGRIVLPRSKGFLEGTFKKPPKLTGLPKGTKFTRPKPAATTGGARGTLTLPGGKGSLAGRIPKVSREALSTPKGKISFTPKPTAGVTSKVPRGDGGKAPTVGRRTAQRLGEFITGRLKRSTQTEDVEKQGLKERIRQVSRAITRSPLGPAIEAIDTGARALGRKVGVKYTNKPLREHGKKIRAEKSTQTEDLTKQKPPKEWLDRCVESIEREGREVESPFAVCTASYNKMKAVGKRGLEKDTTGNYIVKLTPEDMDKYCSPCGEKMRKKNVKFIKVSVSSDDLEKYELGN